MRPLRITLAASLAVTGFGLFAVDHTWAAMALELLPDTPLGLWLELLVPLLPVVFVDSMALVLVGGRR